MCCHFCYFDNVCLVFVCFLFVFVSFCLFWKHCFACNASVLWFNVGSQFGSDVCFGFCFVFCFLFRLLFVSRCSYVVCVCLLFVLKHKRWFLDTYLLMLSSRKPSTTCVYPQKRHVLQNFWVNKLDDHVWINQVSSWVAIFGQERWTSSWLSRGHILNSEICDKHPQNNPIIKMRKHNKNMDFRGLWPKQGWTQPKIVFFLTKVAAHFLRWVQGGHLINCLFLECLIILP